MIVNSPSVELDEMIRLLRDEAPRAALLAHADQLDADARDRPGSTVARAVATMARTLTAAAGTANRETWARIDVASRMLTITCAAAGYSDDPAGA